jgi:fatty acid desaturase
MTAIDPAAATTGHAADRAGALRHIDTAVFSRFARPDPRRWLLGVCTEWAIIVSMMAACVAYPSVLLWAVAVFIIGTRQHALGIMAHESVHSLVSTTRAVNDGLGNWLSAYPLMYSVQGYRTYHLQHHRWLETEKDPEQTALRLYPREWTFPMPRRRFFYLLCRDMLGGSVKPAADLVQYIWQVPGGKRPQVARVVVFHVSAAALAIALGHAMVYLVLWVVPLFTVALMCFRVRTVAEHSGISEPHVRYRQPAVDTLATTRTTVYNAVMKFLFGPHNMAYHIEHHLFPDVPVFRLRRLHDELMKSPDYARRAKVSRGHAALLDALTYRNAPSAGAARS